jgi:hypothetical protein
MKKYTQNFLSCLLITLNLSISCFAYSVASDESNLNDTLNNNLSMSLRTRNDLDCQRIMTNNYSQDSFLAEYDLDAITRAEFGRDYLARAIKIVRHVAKDKGCASNALNFGHGTHGRLKSRCEEIFKGNPASQMCFIQTNVGMFFVTVSYMEKAQVIFNRWD